MMQEELKSNDSNRVNNENEPRTPKSQELQMLTERSVNESEKQESVIGKYDVELLLKSDIDIDTSTFRQKLDKILNNGKLKKAIEICSAVMSLLIFVIYVISTYYIEINFRWFDILGFVFATLFNIETLWYVYLAQHRWTYLSDIENILFIFTSVLPYFATIDNVLCKQFVESARVFHVFRMRKFIQDNLRINENDVVKHVVSMILTFLTLILVATCMFRVVEIPNINKLILSPDVREYSLANQTHFHDFLYYIVVTIATVGYGDIFPISEEGRVVIVLVIFIAAYLIPKETGQLLTLWENTSIYTREIYKSNWEIPHLVICGKVSVDAMINFCNEWFHSDHGQSEKNVIILNPSTPGQEMRLFLHAGKYEVNLRYLEGDPMIEKDLARTDIIKAKVIVIMTDKYTNDPHSTDHKNILMALAIKKYFLKKAKYESTLYIQLIKPENKIHYTSGLQSLSVNNKITNDRMIIIEEIKMNLLSKSCLIPGIIPLITNLVRSSGSTEETDDLWWNEYLEGTNQEIYRTSLNEIYKNNTFSEISKEIYVNYDAIAFAWEIEIDGKTMISLNPGSFFVEKVNESRKDVAFFLYVICSDKEVADRIAKAEIPFSNQTQKESPLKEEIDNDLWEQNGTMYSKNNKKEAKFKKYMRLRMNDMIQLDEYNHNILGVVDEEDDYFFIKNTTGAPPDLKKDSIRNSLIYRNHIVVCGTHPSLYYYLLPLRAKYIGKENLKYVVILTQDMPKDLWDSISRFENLIQINGSPWCVEDLYRANIEYASKAVILENENTKQCSYDDKMIDSERVFIYKTIKKCNPSIQIMTELVYESNIEYLLPQDELSRLNPNDIQYDRTSVFSSGEVYISSIIDGWTSQAFYNKHIVTIVHQLLAGGKNSGNSTLRNICENVGLKSSNFWQIDIPEKFINKAFIEWYNEFCEYNWIALALYRLPGARDNNTPYVYTKPFKSTLLTHRDKVFVLAINNINTYFEESKATVDWNFQSEEKGQKNSVMAVEDFTVKNINNNNNNNATFAPLGYVQDMVSEIEKQVDNLSNILDMTRTTMQESIASGVKQEIISLLH